MKIQLKRSSVLDGGAAKEPTAAQMEYGELAVNYNDADPAIFIKDAADNIIRIGGVGNISDDGQVEIPSTINPPATPEDGNLWYNPEDGRLYVYYNDGNSSQWVDASPDGWNVDETLDSYVKKDGDNMTGDLTLGTDKIELDATAGSITAAGSITSDSIIKSKSDSGFQAIASASGQFSFRATDNAGDDKVIIKSDGSITAAGNCTFANSGIWENNPDPAIEMQVYSSYCNFSIKNTGQTDNVFQIFDGGTSQGNVKAAITGDGSITAAGRLDTDRGLAIKVDISSDSGCSVIQDPVSNAYSYLGRQNGNIEIGGSINPIPGSSNPNILLNAVDGSASFSGVVYPEAGVRVENLTPAGSVLRASRDNGTITTEIQGSGTIYLGDDLNITSDPDTVKNSANILLNGTDGSAEFANTVKVAPGGVQQISLTWSPTGGVIYLSKSDSTITTTLNGSDGSAQFAGDVTANNVTFNLEADDDTKYTSTTDSEGVETRVYNGAVLDVKDRLQNVLARMDAIEANEITDDATDSALLTLISSLTARLDERDTAIAALTARIETLES